jgi:hypothetical protein
MRAIGISPCADALDTLVLTIVPKVVASAGSDATVCETALPYNISGSSALNYSTVMWTTSGTGNFNNP